MKTRIVRRARHYQKSIAIFIMLSWMMGMARATGETKARPVAVRPVPVSFISSR